MAKIKLGATVVGIRGTIGGICFAANSAGNYASLWHRSTNRRTISQSTARGVFAGLPSLWRSATQDERDSWDSYAADPAQERFDSLGQSYYPSAYNWFCATNRNLISIGEPTRLIRPLYARPTAPQNIAANIYNGPDASTRTTIISFTSGSMDGLWIWAMLAFRSHTGALWTFRGWKLVCAKIQYNAVAVKIYSEVEAAFGTPVAAAPYYMRVSAIDFEGQRGPESQYTDSVIAHP